MKTKWFKTIMTLAVVLFFSVSFIGCSKITQANFDKIEDGMTLEEVTAILGQPSDSSSVDLKILSGSASKWVDEKSGNVIAVQFLNGKVKFKQFTHKDEL